MIDVADVCLVDAHAKGNGRDHDAAVRSHPPVLNVRSLRALHAGVVGTSGETGALQVRRYPLRRPLQRHVDDRRARLPRPQPLQQQRIPLCRRDRRGAQLQVRAIEACHKRTLALDAEAGADILDHGRRGRGGEGQDPLDAQIARSFGQLQVVRPKVVAPLGDAVGFIDGEERDLRSFELREEPLVVEPLGGHVQQLEKTRAEPFGDLACFRKGKRGVQPGRLDAPAAQKVDLVLHQRDERRDDQGDTLQRQGGKLVAERLAAAGREDGQRRLPGQQRLDHRPLAGAELREAKRGVEQISRGHRWRSPHGYSRAELPTADMFVCQVRISLPFVGPVGLFCGQHEGDRRG